MGARRARGPGEATARELRSGQGPRTRLVLTRCAGPRRRSLNMQNDAGEFVDLYVPRKW